MTKNYLNKENFFEIKIENSQLPKSSIFDLNNPKNLELFLKIKNSCDLKDKSQKITEIDNVIFI